LAGLKYTFLDWWRAVLINFSWRKKGKAFPEAIFTEKSSIRPLNQKIQNASKQLLGVQKTLLVIKLKNVKYFKEFL